MQFLNLPLNLGKFEPHEAYLEAGVNKGRWTC